VLDEWSFCGEEDGESTLCRFLIALDELRARLAPGKYPNIEISDEGYLYFNVDTPEGPAEVLALPFGLRSSEPALAVSFPRRAEEVEQAFLGKLHRVANEVPGAEVFAGFSPNEETLAAYKQNQHPPLTLAFEIEEMLKLKERGVFFSYLGIKLPVAGRKLREVERTIKEILSELEKEG
jgi:hypothetical protein